MPKTTAFDREAAFRRLDEMSAASVQRDADEVLRLLSGRWPEVRVAAVEALGRAGVGAAALRAAAKSESNEVVLAAVCEALLTLDDRRSVPILKRLARHHPSALVRRKAVWTVSEILEGDAVPFLKERERSETSDRVRVAIRSALLKNDDRSHLQSLIEMLRSRDYIVRASVANFLADNVSLAGDDRKQAARYVRAALSAEQTRAAAEALNRALARLHGNARKRARFDSAT